MRAAPGSGSAAAGAAVLGTFLRDQVVGDAQRVLEALAGHLVLAVDDDRRRAVHARAGDELAGALLQEWFGLVLTPQYLPGPPPPLWLVMGGRGAGKTRVGAEWVNALARGLLFPSPTRDLRIALVGETLGDVREVMIEGPSGIVATARR